MKLTNKEMSALDDMLISAKFMAKHNITKLENDSKDPSSLAFNSILINSYKDKISAADKAREILKNL
jgi:hypothetical protein